MNWSLYVSVPVVCVLGIFLFDMFPCIIVPLDENKVLLICVSCIHTSSINKNVNIKFRTHDAFLEKPSSGTLNIERLESQVI